MRNMLALAILGAAILSSTPGRAQSPYTYAWCALNADYTANPLYNYSPLICPIAETYTSLSQASGGFLGAEFSRVVGGIHTPAAVVEALALGTPVLCSNLPALRENGGEVPEYFDPLDGAGWRRAVIDYALPASPRRAAQLARLTDWTPPRWEDHFAAVEKLIAEVRAPARVRLAPRTNPLLREPQVDGRETADVR